MKKVILLLCIMFLCGCSVTYDLKIDASNNYYETLTLQEEVDDNSDKDYLYALYLEEYPIYNSEEFLYYAPNEKISGNTYYNKNILYENGLYKSIYKSTFDNDSYTDSRILVTAFEKRNIGYKASSKYYYLELSNLIIFNGDNKINNVVINIEVDDNFVVIDNNADIVNGNMYTWSFNSSSANIRLHYQTLSNYEDINSKKDFIISSDDKTTNTDDSKNDKDNSNSFIIVLLTLICFILFIFSIVIFNKKNIK